MKKYLLSLAILAFGMNAMVAENPIASISFTKGSTAYDKVGSYSAEWASTDGMWKFQGFNNNNNGWDFIAAGWKSGESTPFVASGKVCPLPVSSIVFNIGDRLTTDAITSAKLFIADDADFTNATETVLTLPSEKNSEWVVSVAAPSANKFYKVQFEIPKQSSNGQALSFTKIALYQNPYEAGETPVDPDPDPVVPADGDDFTLANTLTSGGRYAIVADSKAGILFTQAYGYMKTSAVSIADNKFKFEGENAITISKVDGADTYTLLDSKKMYLGMDTEHANTFQLNAAAGDGYQWTVEIAADGIATITNTLTGKHVMMDPQYGSFGMYTGNEVKDTFIMPSLYITDAAAPVVPDPVDPDPTPSDVIELDADNAADIQGTLIEEAENSTGGKTAKHVQPLESLEIDGYKFTFSEGANTTNSPAYYWPTSTNTNGKVSIRLYKDNTMTITAPEGKEFTSIVAIPDNSSTEVKIYSGEATTTCTFTATGTTRMKIFKIGSGEVETPTPDEGVEFQLSATVTSGAEYALVADNRVSQLFTKNYGYMPANEVTIADGKFKADANLGITITKVEGKDTYTLLDSSKRYLGMSKSYAKTFQLNATAEEGYEWTIEIEDDGVATIINTLTGAKIMMDMQYHNFGVYTDDEVGENFEMPYLYKIVNDGSIVTEIETTEDCEPVYYNLQGIKVANPEKGLYIRVQGKKATKVILR